DKRCREAKYDPITKLHEQPFGGLMVYFFGDFRQLPPVRDVALYSDPNNPDPAVISGLMNFNYSFHKFFRLTQCHRQKGEDSKDFRFLLAHLAKGYITDKDFEMLLQRNITNDNDFKDAIRIFPTNK